ncbi:hypothetical protein Avbf_13494, partial [Armadillidium vulgare]
IYLPFLVTVSSDISGSMEDIQEIIQQADKNPIHENLIKHRCQKAKARYIVQQGKKEHKQRLLYSINSKFIINTRFYFWYLILYYWISRDIPSATDVDVYTILHCDLTYWFRLSNIN